MKVKNSIKVLFLLVSILAFEPSVSYAHENEGGGGDCSVGTACYIGNNFIGVISCGGSVCSRTSSSVTCDGITTYCP